MFFFVSHPTVTLAEDPVLSESRIEDLKETISNMKDDELFSTIRAYDIQTDDVSNKDAIVYQLMIDEENERTKGESTYTIVAIALGSLLFTICMTVIARRVINPKFKKHETGDE